MVSVNNPQDNQMKDLVNKGGTASNSPFMQEKTVWRAFYFYPKEGVIET